jgi:NUMOD4 motif-containing protein/HNH endonuclease
MTEEWRPVVGHETDYEVSNLGRVRSLDRILMLEMHWKSGIVKTVRHPRKGRILKPGMASNGYLTVNIVGRNRCIHILVLAAFLGPCPPALEACHNDGIKTNNRLDNLRWDTRKANAADSHRHGTRIIGSKHSQAKLTEDTAKQIWNLRGTLSQSALAEKFNVSPAAVQAVHDERTWRHAR